MNKVPFSCHTHSISLEERKVHINRFPIFCLLTENALHHLALQMEEIHVEPEEIIVNEGEIFDAFYLIIDGEASVSKSLKRIQKTSPRHIITLSPKDSIGLIDSGFRSPHGIRTATVTALSPMVLLKLELFQFYMFLQEHGAIYPSLRKMSEKFLLLHLLHQTPYAQELLGPHANELPEEIKKHLAPANEHQINPDPVIIKKKFPGKIKALFSFKTKIINL